MRYFRSLLASLYCAQRNNHITFRKARAWNNRETGTVPTDVLPRGDRHGLRTLAVWKENPDFTRHSRLKGWPFPEFSTSLCHKVQESMSFLNTHTHTFPFLPPPSIHHPSNSYVKSDQGTLYCRAHSKSLAQSQALTRKVSISLLNSVHKSSSSLLISSLSPNIVKPNLTPIHLSLPLPHIPFPSSLIHKVFPLGPWPNQLPFLTLEF
jgi:hypothetical protein